MYVYLTTFVNYTPYCTIRAPKIRYNSKMSFFLRLPIYLNIISVIRWIICHEYHMNFETKKWLFIIIYLGKVLDPSYIKPRDFISFRDKYEISLQICQLNLNIRDSFFKHFVIFKWQLIDGCVNYFYKSLIGHLFTRSIVMLL